DVLAIVKADPARSDMGYVGSLGAGRGFGGARRGAGGPPAARGTGDASGGVGSTSGEGAIRPNFGPQGLALIKPPWGRIVAMDMNTGDHVWMIPNGDTPDSVKNHPALKGMEFPKTSKPERSPLLVTKTLLFGADGAGMFNAGPGGGGR